MKKLIFTVAFLSLAFTSCSIDETANYEKTPVYQLRTSEEWTDEEIKIANDAADIMVEALVVNDVESYKNIICCSTRPAGSGNAIINIGSLYIAVHWWYGSNGTSYASPYAFIDKADLDENCRNIKG